MGLAPSREYTFLQQFCREDWSSPFTTNAKHDTPLSFIMCMLRTLEGHFELHGIREAPNLARQLILARNKKLRRRLIVSRKNAASVHVQRRQGIFARS